jgi:CDP-diacylglycerol--glycerol-3-phosphate 3-phosphatidyltransferase
MNLPNALTVTRIFLMPLLVIVLLTKFEGRHILGVPEEIVGAGIFGLASLTDWLDGYLARRRKQVTTFGQVIDPLADKLLICAALISLAQLGLAPAWMVWIIIGREFAITGLRSLAYARGVVIPASPLGKIKMVSEVVAILALILSHLGSSIEMNALYLVGQLALWVVVAAALVSAADYFRRFNTIVVSPRVADISIAREQRPGRRVG